MYEVVYRGERSINSVQLHKKYNYKWRYRERYDVKVNIIADAVNTIGMVEDTFKTSIRNSMEKAR